MELDAEFIAFVHRRGERHLRTAVLLTGDWHAAEDLVQSALIRLYQAWPRLDTTDDPDAYLRRIMLNTRRSWWRSQWRREVPVDGLPESVDPADVSEQLVLSDAVRRALATLPARQRAALVLRYFEDLPEAEVARLMGCSTGSVKTHTHRGLRAMRTLLPDPLTLDGLASRGPMKGSSR